MSELVPLKKKMDTVRAMLESRQSEIARAIPRGLDPQRFLRVALTNLQVTPALLDCTPASLLTAVMQAAQWGLELDPVLGQAYLVPFKGRATLIIGYRGLLEMARRHPSIESITGRLVYEKDPTLAIEYGLRPTLTHVPYLGAEKGEVIGAYCVWRLKDAKEPEFIYMSRAEIDAIRTRSRAGTQGPWVTDYDMMALKTVLRRASRFWPQTTDLGHAVATDERLELGIEPPTIEIEPAPEEPKRLADVLPPAQAPAEADVLPDDLLAEIREQDRQVSTAEYVDHPSPPPIIPAERTEVRNEHATRHEPRKAR